MVDSSRAEHTVVNVEEINERVKKDLSGFIELSEQRYYEQISCAAAKIAENVSQSPIVMLSGPSASAKTTTANKISAALTSGGTHAITVSMDDFFVDRSLLPRLENGELDYESVDTVDLETLNDCLERLVKNHEADFPIFDFKNGRRSSEVQRVEMNSRSVIIIEGIHALNPKVLSYRNAHSAQKMYVSPHSDFYVHGCPLLPSRQLRFVRRVIRDYFYRGNSIKNTIKMWDNVIKAEVVNIMPYRVNADITIDSTILYEPCIYHQYLRRVMASHELDAEDETFMRIFCEILSNFADFSVDLIPGDTVLREFIN